MGSVSRWWSEPRGWDQLDIHERGSCPFTHGKLLQTSPEVIVTVSKPPCLHEFKSNQPASRPCEPDLPSLSPSPDVILEHGLHVCGGRIRNTHWNQNILRAVCNERGRFRDSGGFRIGWRVRQCRTFKYTHSSACVCGKYADLPSNYLCTPRTSINCHHNYIETNFLSYLPAITSALRSLPHSPSKAFLPRSVMFLPSVHPSSSSSPLHTTSTMGFLVADSKAQFFLWNEIIAIVKPPTWRRRRVSPPAGSERRSSQSGTLTDRSSSSLVSQSQFFGVRSA